MDDVTARRHSQTPDYVINLQATGVMLPSGKVSWRLNTSDTRFSSKHNPKGLTSIWWAGLFADWAKSFLNRGLQNKK